MSTPIDPASTIQEPYLLVVNIPAYRDGGRFWVEPLWRKDLDEHVAYLEQLALACPVIDGPAPAGHEPLPAEGPGPSISIVGLGRPRPTKAALPRLPIDFWRLWKAVGRSRVVHCGVAGWPIPLGWLAAPIARLRGRLLLVNVESAPWRPTPGPGPKPGLASRFRSALFEAMARRCVALADLPFFTQAGYRDSLLGPRADRGHVVPASWIDGDNILDADSAEQIWADRLADAESPLRLAFAARLVPEKGVRVILDALAILDAQGVPVVLDLYGTGPLAEECEAASRQGRGIARVRALGTLPYGPEFFEALRPYHAFVVPNLADEQPRIVYDAQARALPVLASDTPGLRECVHDGLDGLFAPPGDPDAWASLIRRVADDRDSLRRLGLHALRSASALTHSEMHRKRKLILQAAIASRHRAR